MDSHTDPHDAKARLTRRLRFAFGGVAFSLLLMAAAALLATDRLSRLVESTGSQTIPAMRDALHLSEQGALLTASLPALLASPDQTALAGRWAGMDANLSRIRAHLDGPSLASAPEAERQAIDRDLNAYTTLLVQLRQASAERLQLAEAQRAELAALRTVHASLVDTVGPLTYGVTSLSRLLVRRDARDLELELAELSVRFRRRNEALYGLREALARPADTAALHTALVTLKAELAPAADGSPAAPAPDAPAGELAAAVASALAATAIGPQTRHRLDDLALAALATSQADWQRAQAQSLAAVRTLMSSRLDDTATQLAQALDIKAEGNLLLALLTSATEVGDAGTLIGLQDRAARSLAAFRDAAASFAVGPLAERNPILAGNVAGIEERLAEAATGAGGVFELRRRQLALAGVIDGLLGEARTLAAALTEHIGVVVGRMEAAAAATRTRALAERNLTLALLGIACLTGLALSGFIAWITTRALARDRVALRQARDETEEANRILAAVGYSARRILGSDRWDDAIDSVLARLGAAAGADHVLVLERRSGPGPVILDAPHAWARDSAGLPTLAAGLDLTAAGLGRWARRLARGAPIYGAVDALPLHERPLLHGLGIGSLLAAPIRVNQAWWGHLTVAVRARRSDWPAPLVAALGAAADMLGAAIAHDRAGAQVRQAATVFESTSEGVIITDAGYRILAVNRAFTALTGFAATEVIGQSPLVIGLGRQHGPSLRDIRRLVERDGHWRGEVQNSRRDGSPLPAWLSISAIRDGRGRPQQYAVVFSDISALKQSERELDFLAHHDALTGLPNRVQLHERIAAAIARARRGQRSMALLFLDLDRFKNINDSLGHAVGDALLKQVAARLQAAVRVSDSVARLGGDEFVLILEDIASQADAEHRAEELLALLREPFHAAGHRLFVSASIGLSLHPGHGDSAEELIRNSDTAMYRAKSAGKDTWRPYSLELTAAARRRLSMEGELRGAIVNGELELYYQPQCSTEDGRIVALEALLRWRSPSQGRLLGPDEFLPVARDSGLIVEIGDLVLTLACEQCRDWQRAGFDDVRVCVNIALEQLLQGETVASTRRALSLAGLPGSALELELTEDSAASQIERIRATLLELRALGVSLAIDDFGTGYSSLSHLKRLPFETLKIDRSFVGDIPEDVNDMAIAHAVVVLAHTLKMSVVAEGVETPAQLHFLRKVGCDLIQGHLYSRPVPANEVISLLRAGRGHISVRALTPVG